MASIWALIGSFAAADMQAAGVPISNITAVDAAIAKGPAKGGWQWKVVLLVAGIGSIFVILFMVHAKVHAALQTIQDGEEQVDEEQEEEEEEEGLACICHAPTSMHSSAELKPELEMQTIRSSP
eukprot:gnl/TRDRNA2_/TRDRNA2_171204_c0_seq2.p2 gnl/TRDRNA2_/TRDRNA2_171204_c0~~gnl/TRDRNA2_/TRDRNA2_171204_c0_seq2.p2  ORF type:complete len:124 (+),score=32.37 gnl/TRDRNA2_/TRDRNA2_171204_c0_seq2:159-530(+)